MTRVVTPAGVAAGIWTARLARESAVNPLALLDVAPGDNVVVVGAHPDDETLGVGGILHRVASSGARVTLIVATDGEAAYGPTGPPAAELASTRRHELAAALVQLRVDAEVRWLGLPDGRLVEHESAIADAVGDTLRSLVRDQGTAPAVVLATWLNDPHPDHAAVGRAARTAAQGAAWELWWYPIWMRDRFEPHDAAVPWAQLRVVRLEPADLVAKSAAVAAYRSQVSGPDADTGPVIPPASVAQFVDGYELLIASAPSSGGLAAHFDAAHQGSTPAWADDNSWYETRKRAVVMASLPSEAYDCAWEPGASVGHLTRLLARRCRRVVASDVSPVAVEAARSATAQTSGVQIDLAQTPRDTPPLADASCDLIVLAEVLYYLEPADRHATLALVRRLLAPGGHVVVVHWRHYPDDAYCSGEDANREVVEHFGDRLVHHDDAEFVLDVVTA